MNVDYKHLFDTAIINGQKIGELKQVAEKIKDGQSQYESVAAKLNNGIPWWFIGITHFMEAGAFHNPFLYHLHCGDPLTGRTIHVPKGRPEANPGGGSLPPSKENPYSWEESALDALRYMKYDHVRQWDIATCLYYFERYNGMGYNKRGLLSPYLWSYTQHYTKGKFTFDGHFDPNAVSQQPGVVSILKMLDI